MEKEQNATATVPVLRVQSIRAGFRRAGRAWTVEPVDVPLSDLSEAQVAQLKAEPLLVVAEITIGAPVAKSADPAGGFGAAPAPSGPAERQAAILAATAKLDPANAANWTAAGSPATAALAGALGWVVTAAERDAAWAQHQAAGQP